jgi:hypothetical protein
MTSQSQATQTLMESASSTTSDITGLSVADVITANVPEIRYCADMPSFATLVMND